MAVTAEEIRQNYPLPSYHYRVTIDDTQIGFQQVSGLRLAYEMITYRHGLSDWAGVTHVRGQRKPVEVALKRGIAPRRSGLLAWFQGDGERDRTVLIDLLDATGQATVRWTVLKAVPTALQASALGAEQNGVVIETLIVTAQTLTLEYLDS